MGKLLFELSEKVAVLVLVGLSAIGHAVSVPVVNDAQPAAVSAEPATIFSSLPSIFANLPDVPPGTLPTSTLRFCSASSSCGQSALRILGAAAAAAARIASLVNLPVKSSSSSAPKITIIKAPSPAPAVTAAVSSHVMTPQEFLQATTVSFKESIHGPFYVMFNTPVVGGNAITWNSLTQTVGGTKNVPQFAVSVSCNPPPDIASADMPSQDPLFPVNVSYRCAVSLAPTTGSDRRVQSRDFSFTTPSGQLTVASLAISNHVLANDSNASGIVFENQDSLPVTVTGVTVDVSYTALDHSNGPLVLRFSDPITETSLFDYHLENAPKDSTAAFTNRQENISAPLSFTIPAGTQKMLPVSILGVQRMLMPDVKPTVTVTVRSVTTDHSLKAVLRAPVITWSCVVALGGYNPNATSDPFATGEACRN